ADRGRFDRDVDVAIEVFRRLATAAGPRALLEGPHDQVTELVDQDRLTDGVAGREQLGGGVGAEDADVLQILTVLVRQETAGRLNDVVGLLIVRRRGHDTAVDRVLFVGRRLREDAHRHQVGYASQRLTALQILPG